MFYNTNYWLYMAPAFLLMLLASWYVNSTYRKWGKIPASSRLNGYEAARRLITAGGLYGVQIEGIGGNLTDNYDPRSKTLRLSQAVAQGNSVAALAVSAHELGHAMQDSEDYFPLRLRAALVPAVNIGSNLGWILIMLGLFLNWVNVAWLGVFAFSVGAVFAFATLPVELNASARARQLLMTSGLVVTEEERRGVNNVLNAAALTYVAGLLTAVLQLLYFVSMVGGMGGRRRR